MLFFIFFLILKLEGLCLSSGEIERKSENNIKVTGVIGRLLMWEQRAFGQLK